VKVIYFYRHPEIGFSIEKVFNIIEKEVGNSANVSSYKAITKYSLPWDILFNSYHIFKGRTGVGVNHVTGHIHDVVLGLIGCKSVITFHDLVFLDNVSNPIKRFYKFLFWVYIPVKLATKVTCISEHTKRNLLKYVKTDKIHVVHNPVDPSYTFAPKQFNSQKPVILHIGTGWNKNLNNTAKALSDIPCHLRIIGRLNDSQKETLNKYSICFSNSYKLTDDEIRLEYERSDIVSFPSIYEGFGMPIIEGQAIGRPVVTSRIEPLIEVSGDAVCYVNPLDVDSIKQGFKKIINDVNYRESVIKTGLENVRKFQIESIAKKYLDVYKSL
jgi:glycosyltransferase involved in cell wall biosynthesis